MGVALLAAPLAANAQSASTQSQTQTILQQITQLQQQLAALRSQHATTTPSTTGGQSDWGPLVCSFLDHDIAWGANDTATSTSVTFLQRFLSRNYSTYYPQGLVTGYYGSATQAAIKRYQQAHGISQTGYVGPLTRAAIEAECNGTGGGGTGGGIASSTTPYALTAQPSSGSSPLTVAFTATPVGTADASTWYAIDFGDGSRGTMTVSSSTLSASHTYTKTGTFTVRLLRDGALCGTVGSYSYGCTREFQEDSIRIVVTSSGSTQSGVSLSSLSPQQGSVGTQVTLTGSGFTSLNVVNFGSGTITNVSSSNGTTLTFGVPSYVAPYCAPYTACPAYAQQVTSGTYNISVQNVNGTSNTLTFQVQ